MINPTGGGIRNDSEGSGYYGAKRGDRQHHGIDFHCHPGQPVKSPIDGSITRIARPYADSEEYSGCVIQGKRISVKLFYLSPFPEIIGKRVTAGETIGKAQDISRRYSDKMTPHIHLEIDHCDPLLFLDMP